MSKKAGRPPLNDWDKYQIAHKLEPYLKMGLSVKNACRQSGVPSSTVYKYLQADEGFMDQITGFQQYYSVLVSKSIMAVMLLISEKQDRRQALSRDDLRFLMWIATHSNQTREEFDHRGESLVKAFNVDPYLETKQLLRYIEEARHAVT